MSGGFGLIIAFIIMLVLIFMNAPVYTAILAAGLFINIFVNQVPITSMFTIFYESVAKTNLLAIPFFIMAGNMLGGGSLGRRLIDVFDAFFGSVRGGLAISCLVANGVFGAISGSAPAATAVFCKISYEPLAKSENESLASGLVISAAGLSGIIPPSIPMILYGISCNVSVGNLFIAGIIPGLLVMLIIAIYLLIVCKKPNDSNAFSFKNAGKALVRGIPVLVMPVLILGGIYSGLFTPTEAGAVCCLYCIIVSVCMREMTFKHFIRVTKDSLLTVAKCFCLIMASNVLSRALTICQFPQQLAVSLGGMSKVGFLLLVNLILIIIGCFFEPSAAILVMAPLFATACEAIGINLIHFGIIMVVNIMLGGFTPPFGLNIFVAQSILGKNMATLTKSLLPFIVLYLVAMLIITFIPQLSTFLVDLM